MSVFALLTDIPKSNGNDFQSTATRFSFHTDNNNDDDDDDNNNDNNDKTTKLVLDVAAANRFIQRGF
jgi:hypothetical protein